jgi:hypothetical protein
VQLAPAIERVMARTDMGPRAVTADRGSGVQAVHVALQDVGSAPL